MTATAATARPNPRPDMSAAMAGAGEQPFSYQLGELYCDRVALSTIADAVGTPVYVYSATAVRARADALRRAIPGHRVYYAVKANGHPAIIRLLAEAGLGADVTSGGEYFLAVQGGVAPGDIIFSGVGKREDEITAALAGGVGALHVESAAELDIVAAVAARLERVAAVGIRVNPDIRASTHPKISTGERGHKFGVPAADALPLLRRAAATPSLRPAGLAVHLGSQIQEPAPYDAATRFLLDLAAEAQAAGVALDYLDVGGGLGLDYIDYTKNTAADLTMWARRVTAPIAAAGYQAVLEPGRALVAPAGALLATVLYDKSQGGRRFLVTDTGMNDLLRPTLYQAHHPVLPLRAPATAARHVVDVVGPICETGDFLAQERALPPVAPGERLAVLLAGAYAYAMSSNYNGRPRPAEVLVDGDRVAMIRRRQGIDALLDGIPAELLGQADGAGTGGP